MTELLTAAQMRAIEQAAIASGEVTGLELMERAGAGVVAAVLEEWPELATTSHRAVVLCGPGNNGGDGFVVARLLKQRGWEVEVFLYGDPERLPPDARVNYERWTNVGEAKRLPFPGLPSEQGSAAAARLTESSPTVLVDAIFGTGLARPLGADLRSLRLPLHTNPHLVAVDVPTGLCSDSGFVIEAPRVGSAGCLFQPDLTVTFGSAKLGHYLADGPGYCRRLNMVDIGLDRRLLRLLGRPYDPVTRRRADYSAITDLTDADALRPGFSSSESILDKGYADHTAHKYTHGHALILSGPATRTGAARLAARAALRIGAGLVTVAAPREALAEHAARLEAIMLRLAEDGAELAGLLEDRRINALCLGPGLGLDERAAGLVKAALEASAPAPAAAAGPRAHSGPPGSPGPRGGPGAVPPRALVLDADALTLIARDPALFAALHDRCVLTPHAGEFARLFPDLAAKLAEPATRGPAYSKVDATREAAARAGCVVLYKGPDTVIADPSGACAINSAAYDRAAPWLATAGSGDVLAGMIAGLLARGFAPMAAAETAAWLHVECALSFGPGLIAEDLPEELPKVFRRLGL